MSATYHGDTRIRPLALRAVTVDAAGAGDDHDVTEPADQAMLPSGMPRARPGALHDQSPSTWPPTRISTSHPPSSSTNSANARTGPSPTRWINQPPPGPPYVQVSDRPPASGPPLSSAHQCRCSGRLASPAKRSARRPARQARSSRTSDSEPRPGRDSWVFWRRIDTGECVASSVLHDHGRPPRESLSQENRGPPSDRL